MKHLKKLTILFLFSSLIFTMSCKKPGSVTVSLKNVVNGEYIELYNLIYDSPATHKYSVENLKYYLSRINLIDEDGNKVLLKDYFLTDIHEEGTDKFTVDDVPAGNYKNLSFVFGLDKEMNVKDGLPNTVDNINMIWPATPALGSGGYHYMKYEGRYDSLNTGTIKSFAIHLGPTLDNENYFDVTLPVDITIKDNTVEMEIDMDLQEWLQNPNLYDFSISASNMGIMQDQSLQEIVKANGPTVFSVKVK